MMTVVDLESLARAYQSTECPEPEILVLGHHLPESNYEHGPNWNAILSLGKYKGKYVRFYAPRAWRYNEPDDLQSDGSYQFVFSEEPTLDTEPPHIRNHEEFDRDPDETHVDFTLTVPEGTIDRIIFLNACNNGNMLPSGAERLTEKGIVPDYRATP